MASFTETATLLVRDGSTGPINKINKALKDLFKTARSLKSVKVEIGATAKGLSKASADIRKLTTDLKQLKSATASIKVNVSGIQQAQRQLNALRTQAAKPIKQQFTPSGVPRVAAPRGGAASQPVHSAFVANVVQGVAHQIGAALVREVGHLGRTGTRDIEIGKAALDIRQMGDPKDRMSRRSIAEEEISKIQERQRAREGGAIDNRGQISSLYAEALGTFAEGASKTIAESREAQRAAGITTDQMLETKNALIGLGKTAEDARESSLNWMKALDSQGWLTDPATGKFDETRAAEAFNFIRTLIPELGKEMSGDLYRQIVKYTKEARITLTKPGTAVAMYAAEEMGTSAGVGVGMFSKQAQGFTVTKEAKKYQAQLGVDTAEARAAAAEDPLKYVNDFWIPALEKRLKSQGKSQSQIDTLLNDAKYLQTEANKTVSASNARTLLGNVAFKRQEYERREASRLSRSGTIEANREALKENLPLIAAGLTSQVEGVMGQAVSAFAPELSSVMGTISGALSQVSEDMAKARRGDPEAKAKVAGEATFAAIAAVGSTSGFVKLSTALAAVATPLGTIAAVQATMSKDPGTRGLGFAAEALIGSAGALTNAAVALGGKSVLDNLGGGPEGGGGDKNKPKTTTEAEKAGKKPPSVVRRLLEGGKTAGKWVLRNGAWILLQPEVAIPLAAAAAITAAGGWRSPSDMETGADRTKEATEADRKTRLSEEALRTSDKIDTADINLANATRALADARKSGMKSEIAARQKMVDDFRKQAADYRAQYAMLIKAAQQQATEGPTRTMLPPMPKEPPKPFTSFIDTRKPVPVYLVKEGRTKPEIDKQGKPALKQAPVPTPDPRKLGGVITAPPESSINLLTKANESLGASAVLLGQKADTFKIAADATKTSSESLTTAATKLAETPEWVNTLKQAMDGTKEAGTKFATAADVMKSASETTATSATSLATSTTNLATSSQTIATTMGTTVAGLNTAGSNFAQVFGTAAQSISSAGQTAASTIVAAMPGAGAALGAAAAAAISAAVANIHVAVDVNQNRKDTGTMGPP